MIINVTFNTITLQNNNTHKHTNWVSTLSGLLCLFCLLSFLLFHMCSHLLCTGWCIRELTYLANCYLRSLSLHIITSLHIMPDLVYHASNALLQNCDYILRRQSSHWHLSNLWKREFSTSHLIRKCTLLITPKIALTINCEERQKLSLWFF